LVARKTAKAGKPAARGDAPARTTIAGRLARAGLESDWNFVLHLPLRYEDETQLTPIATLTPGSNAQVEGDVVAADVVYRGRRQFHVTLRDASGKLVLRFLHFYPSHTKQLAVGRRVRVYGTVRSGLAGSEMVHPRVQAADVPRALPGALTPVYTAPEGVPQSWLRKRIERAVADVDLADVLPSGLLQRYRLMALRPALERLHRPPPGADLDALTARSDPAWERVKFDELLAQQIALREAREKRAASAAPALPAGGALTKRLLAQLPFALTAAQRRVWREIERDLAMARPMHRLLQGDVGSGKTIVAALAAARAIECGHQAALMAPTELLAEQHFGRIAQWLAPLGIEVAWLAGRLSAPVKRAARQAVASGAAQLVVGTHALIQEGVDFARLGLAIVDEQHRFGVAQRLALRGDRAAAQQPLPHLLMLSATPIPRTLAMSYLADLDVSSIDELPPGRRRVVTKLVSTRRRDEVLRRIRADVRAGRQAYWVCPLVAESDVVEAAAATETYRAITALLPELSIGLAHGALPPAEKTDVMRRFVAREIDVLVATTVIEVGVDVANATLMVIEHAERFGLAQLHQLRGRVGRGGDQSYCILLYEEPLADAARERLKVIFETSDGFEVARRDLMMRGPGEFLGARQSGVPLLRFADLQADAGWVERAREAAAELLANDPQAAAEHLRRWLQGRQDYLTA
jgi:ATP-dependent DNA helicase RecG